MFIRPAVIEGKPLKVRNPKTMRHLPADGMEVPETSYWLRRVACGDVFISATSQIPEQPAEPEALDGFDDQPFSADEDEQ